MREVQSTVSHSQGSGIFFRSTGEKTCSRCGHSHVDKKDELQARTRRENERAVEDGGRMFILGGRSDFDDLCYDLVTEKRRSATQN